MLDFHPEIALLTFSMAKTTPPTFRAPFSGEEFQDAIFRSLSRGTSGAGGVPGVQCRTIAFLPAKAGSGATTTALATALMVAQRLGKRVLFLECDVHSGPVGLYLGLRPSHSIVSVLEDAAILDRRPLTELVTRSNGIDVLPSIGARPTHVLSAWNCQRLLSRARSMYDYVFCDLPDIVGEGFEPVIRGAEQIVIVTTPSAPSVFLAERRLGSLSQLGVPMTKVGVVTNRMQGNEHAIERIKQCPVVASIPNRPTLMDAPLFDMKKFLGNNLEPALHLLAEFCVGHPIAKRRSTGFSLTSLWCGTNIRLGQSANQEAGG
jgi:Flp pilus assembly CpaE family ATPase